MARLNKLLAVLMLAACMVKATADGVLSGPIMKTMVTAAAGSPPTFVAAYPVDYDGGSDDPETQDITITNTLSNGAILLFNASGLTFKTDSATFAGTNAPLQTSITNAGAGYEIDCYGKALGNIASGSYTISWDKATSGQEFTGYAVLFADANQTTPFGLTNQAAASGTSAPMSFTAGADKFVVGAVTTVGVSTHTPGAGQTEDANSQNSVLDLSGSHILGTGSMTFTTAFSGTEPYATVGVIVNGL